MYSKRDFTSQPEASPPRYPESKASGYRIDVSASSEFLSDASNRVGKPPCLDADGTSPVYLGSATLTDHSVHPCKIVPHIPYPCRVPYDGEELWHCGPYNFLAFDPETMEWVTTSRGRIPDGREPVQGGIEDNGEPLYHAIGVVHGVRVPGKTGVHLVSVFGHLWSLVNTTLAGLQSSFW